MKRVSIHFDLLLFVILGGAAVSWVFPPALAAADAAAKDMALAPEMVPGDGVWVSREASGLGGRRGIEVKVWFDRQLLGDGEAYLRRAGEISGSGMGRTALREAAVRALKEVSDESWAAAEQVVKKLVEDGVIENVERHWIVNGFTCRTAGEKGVEALKTVTGVKKLFLSPARGGRDGGELASAGDPEMAVTDAADGEFNPEKFKHPWYIRSLQADRVWREFGVTGEGTLNVIHDGNFLYPDTVAKTAYRNPGEVAGNGKDDDGNGLVDDVHGYNFSANSAFLTTDPATKGMPGMHGTMCAAVICGVGTEKTPYEFGIAPRGRWAGVIAGAELEAAVEWAIEQGADTYSMSFSRPNLGEVRSHWRKVMEHGSLCGVYFVSGAGNFAQTDPIPVQMRTPEDIPNVVFAAAGVRRDLSRTPFSSKGPVEWKTEHYQDGRVQKPEVCAFNRDLPMVAPDGTVRETGMNGNSFAGPMFCGSIALMLSADPDLLPWDLKEIITATATDVGPRGVDDETGHGLINCYRAVKEVLRRRMLREGNEDGAAKYAPDAEGDALTAAEIRAMAGKVRVILARLRSGGMLSKAGIIEGDGVVSIDGQAIATRDQMRDVMRKDAAQGDSSAATTTWVILRDGEEKSFEVGAGQPGIAGVMERFEGAVFE